MVDIQKYLDLRDKYIEQRFSNLNDAQRKAALHTQGPEMILAGAGSGKTTVLINKIVNLLKFGTAYKNNEYSDDFLNDSVLNELDAWGNAGCSSTVRVSDEAERALAVDIPNPWNILAITFTNKAANELKSRIAKNVGDTAAKDIQASTFHSLCAKILRKEYSHTPFSSHFTIYDSDDSKRVLKSIINEMYGSDETLGIDLDASTALDYISSFKDELKTLEDVDNKLSELGTSSIEYMYMSLYKPYQKELQKSDAMDFGDLIINTVELFRKNKAIYEKYSNRYKYVLVDEYQDINEAQNVLINLLATGWFNICIVGDEDQSIYGFRGANVENILNFPEAYPSVFQVKLEQNYRSTQNIVGLATSVIVNNKNRYDKRLWTANESGDKVSLTEFTSSDEEANAVISTIIDNNLPYKGTAVLYRMNSQSSSLEQAFLKNKIPYKIVGGLKFFDRKEIKDMMAYLHIIANSNDSLRLKRIINVPARKIGSSTIDKIEALSKNKNTSMLDICRQASTYTEIKRSSKALESFCKIYDSLCKDAKNFSLSDLIHSIYISTGYDSYLDSQSNADDRKLNINQLEQIADSYEERHKNASLSDFLEEISLMTDTDNYNKDDNCVTMMTIHSSKGLEFDNVFLVGWADGIFPTARVLQEIDIVRALEEERRLAYVAITRARKNLWISWADAVYLWGSYNEYTPSRFIKEFDDSKIKFSGTYNIKKNKSNKYSSKSKENNNSISIKPGDIVVDSSGKRFTVEGYIKAGNCHIVNIKDSFGQTTRVIWEYAKLLKL